MIITHGWPGSVIEMLGVVGPLTDPAAHGGSAEDAFDLVLPSLPGYGLSAEPAEAGWNVGRIAGAWAELMRRLGYARYVADARHPHGPQRQRMNARAKRCACNQRQTRVPTREFTGAMRRPGARC